MTNPLDQLHDIQVAEQMAFVPLSWGWWVLFALMIVGLMYCTLAIRKRRRQRQLQRRILIQLEQADSVLAIHTLVRRATLMLWPSSAVAALTGRPWQEFWLATWSPCEQAQIGDDYDTIMAAMYRPQPELEQVELYRRLAIQWIQTTWWPRLITMKREVS